MMKSSTWLSVLLLPLVAAPAVAQQAPQRQGIVPSQRVPLVLDAWSNPIIWRAPDGYYAAAVHATLMPDGRILFMGFERDTLDPLLASDTRRSAFIFTPTPLGQPLPKQVVISNLQQPIDADNTFVPPSSIVTDQLYCSGHTLTADGDFFTAGGLRTVIDTVSGGTSFVGLSYATIFNNSTWTRVPADMTVVATMGSPARYYPTCTRLSDGRILVTGGYDRILPGTAENLSAEAYGPPTGSWDILSDFGATPSQIFNPDYTHPFVLPQRLYSFYDILMFGEDALPLFFSLGAAASWASGAVRPGTLGGQTPNFGATSALLSIRVDNGEWGYANGSVLIAGGDHDTSHQQHVDIYDAAANSWLPRVDMGVARHHPTSVILPDARILVVAGHDEGGDPNVGRTSYIDPAGGFQHVLGEQTVPEINGYHHVAILLPDGRVLVGGGRDEDTFASLEKPTFRYYYPTYMLKERPTIDLAPSVLTLGQSFSVQTSGKKPFEVVLIGLGSMTHSFDANQRHIELEITANSPVGAQHFLTVNAPPDTRVAPPGFYMLFVLDKARAPSEARILQVL